MTSLLNLKDDALYFAGLDMKVLREKLTAAERQITDLQEANTRLLERARAAEAASPAAGWRDIATAAKDGKVVFLDFGDGAVSIGVWRPPYCLGEPEPLRDGYWRCLGRLNGPAEHRDATETLSLTMGGDPGPPLRWLPFPSVPAPTEEARAG